MTRGFTLIETIIYIALFGMLMSGAVIFAYQLFGTSAIVSGKTVVQTEGNFVLAKMRYALSSASGVTIISPDELLIARYGDPAIRVKRVGTRLEFSRNNGATYEPITTDNVSVSAFTLAEIPAVGEAPEGIVVTTAINGMDFVLSAYIRK